MEPRSPNFAEGQSEGISLRVLVADDHESMLQQAVSILRSHFEVIGTASDGKILIAKALRLRPDVIVSDILMPGLTGLEVASQLREIGSTAKLIFLSVYQSGEFARACFSVGASGYVTKDRMGTDLVLAIKEAIEGRTFASVSVQDF